MHICMYIWIYIFIYKIIINEYYISLSMKCLVGSVSIILGGASPNQNPLTISSSHIGGVG
jgi:hypothetical protein